MSYRDLYDSTDYTFTCTAASNYISVVFVYGYQTPEQELEVFATLERERLTELANQTRPVFGLLWELPL